MKNATKLAVCISALLSSPFALANSHYDIGGMVRANYSYIDYDEASKDKGGDFKFEVAAISFNGEMDDFGVSMEYRYRDDFDAIKHGFVYYKPSEDITINAGVAKVPFGNIGFISNSFWLSLQYYVGFEDDYDTGVSLQYNGDSSRTDIAFFKNSETGASSTKQFATDLATGVINGTEYNAEETNQINLRHSVFFDAWGIQSTLGASVELGQIYDSKLGETDGRYAYAIHYDGKMGDWNLQAQWLSYQFDTQDDRNTVAMGVVGATFETASEAQALTVNLAKNIDMSWGHIRAYNDFNVLMPEHSEFDDSYQNVTGFSVKRGPILAWFDFIVGKNMLWSSRSNHVGLKDAYDEWDKRIHINLGYYF